MALTRIKLGRREDLGADCANCFGLCCVALAFSRSSDFPVDKPAGEPCLNLDDSDACRIHDRLRADGYAGCTTFDCFGAGQKVSYHTFGGRSWRHDPRLRDSMFSAFSTVRRLHELLWYLDQAIDLAPSAELVTHFGRVKGLSDGDAPALASLDVDAEYDTARPLLLSASRTIRQGHGSPTLSDRLHPGADLSGARLEGADLRGAELRGALLIGADLSNADLRWCELLGADLRGADLSGARLSSAVYLAQGQLDSARGDRRTELPDGFLRPRHWAL
ncbi:pentapeptide repeat-containing protein [Salinibacterium soli]|uniref:Pentapeptide repeat-containing protein n=1 Tax=Antiquaquibacter soli TaxID=3064523 RepID=A0ABT9BIQ6_9MICO|nr:pentapeptide repeat-containing protein [Protaetiibacter sp. WY-16]MDO7880909.1 pentapeptide repeat-containing protein [Protaetiibacter sp. WY-16]